MRWRTSVFLGVGVLLGSAWIPYSVLLHHIPGLFANALRCSIAAVFATGVALAARLRQKEEAEHRFRAILVPSIVLGVTELALPYALNVWAADRVSTSVALTLFALIPLVALLLNMEGGSGAIPKLVIGAGGVAVLVSRGFSISTGQIFGVLLVAGAVISAAFSLNYARKRLGKGDLLASAAIQFVAASLLLGVLSFATEHGQFTRIDREMALSLILLGVAISGVSLPLLYWMLTESKSWQVGAVYWVTILVGVVEAGALLRAGPSMEMVAGAVLIAGATVWLLRSDDGASSQP